MQLAFARHFPRIVCTIPRIVSAILGKYLTVTLNKILLCSKHHAELEANDGHQLTSITSRSTRMDDHGGHRQGPACQQSTEMAMVAASSASAAAAAAAARTGAGTGTGGERGPVPWSAGRPWLAGMAGIGRQKIFGRASPVQSLSSTFGNCDGQSEEE